jgi:hypothetical protein
MRKFALLILACLALAGCWQTRTRPYRNTQSLSPFAAGMVTETDPGGHVTRYALARLPRGRYRMTQTGKGSDLGDGFELGFFPLPGAPSHVLVYQAAALDHPAGDDSLRYYGLVVITGPKSAREIRPDCKKDARAARASGTVAGKDGACTFATRDGLEKSLLALWKRKKKPAYLWTLNWAS